MKFKFSNRKTFQKRGACSLVFDDGYKETLINVLPLLKKYNLRATFAFTLKPESLEKQGNRPCASLKIAQKLKKLGHEIASHTITHRNLTQLKPEELNKELKESQKILNADIVIYPGGAYNQKVLNCASRYYIAGRSTEEGLNNIPPQDLSNLKTFVLRKNTKWFLLNREAQKAHHQNKWLIETYHLVSKQKQEYRFSNTPRDLEKHLKKLVALNLWIAPLGMVAKYIKKRANY